MKHVSNYIRIFVSIILCVVYTNIYATSQPYAWQLTDENGLQGNEVYTMLQDSQGYVWLGTNGGLARYDGNTFKTYTHPEQRSRSFSNLRLDNNGRVWCNNFGGQIFYVEHDSLILFKEWDKYQKGNFPQFEIIGEELYISSLNNAVKVYSFNNKIWRTINTSAGGNATWTIGCGKTENNNFCFWEIKNGAFVVQNNKPISVSNMGNCGNQYGYYSQSVGKQLFLFDQCGHIMEWEKGKFITSPLQAFASKLKTYILNIHRDADGDYWLLTQDGARCYSPNGELRFHFLPGIPTYSAMQDREGNTWVSTMGHGIYIIPNKNIRMLELKSGAKEYSVSHICPVNDSIVYLATRQGKLLLYNTRNLNLVREINLPDLHDIQSMYYDAMTAKLYICIIHTHVYDTRKQQWDDTQLAGSTFKEITGTKGLLFTAGSSGLSVHSTMATQKISTAQKYKFEMPVNGQLPVFNLRDGRATCVWTNQNGTDILCGFNNGLYHFAGDKKQELLYQGKPLVATRIRSLQNNKVYIATIGKGLFEYINKQVVPIKSITEMDLLNMETDGTQLYITTELGIIVFNPNTTNYYTISKPAGLASSAIADIKLVGSTLWLATSRGVQVIPLQSNFINYTPPKVSISKLSVNDKVIVSSENIVLNYQQNDISIYFSGIGIRSRGQLHFKYRLLGLDTGWTIAGNNVGMARFSSLQPGNYIFEVLAVNEDGINSEKAATISFEIEKPYWQTWWFIVIIIVFAVVILYIFYKWRLNQAKKKASIERNLIESEMKALKSQMNPHFIFNALNSIKEYILTNKPKEAGKYLTKFANLMRAYLDMSEQKSISLYTEIETLQLYLELEALRFRENFSYHIIIDSAIAQDSIYLPPMLIQPYIENAIKHGLLHQTGEKILNIKFVLKDNYILCCTIQDNGIGRAASAAQKAAEHSHHQSFATGATQKRLELLNQQRQHPLTVSYTDLEKGTLVEVWIPVL